MLLTPTPFIVHSSSGEPLRKIHCDERMRSIAYVKTLLAVFSMLFMLLVTGAATAQMN
jgi:hypothetical protein